MRNQNEFIQETIRRAEAAGFRPAALQREVNWEQVAVWAERVQEPTFVWKAGDGVQADAIIVSDATDGGMAVHSGQHRILGGLIGNNPVPAACMTYLAIHDRARDWDTNAATFTEMDLLALLG